MTSKIQGLTKEQCDEVLNIITSFPQIEKAVLFGSRAMGTFKEASDIDIAIDGAGVKTKTAMALKDALEEQTNLPFFFDIIALNDTTEDRILEHINEFGVDLISNSRWQTSSLDNLIILGNGKSRPKTSGDIAVYGGNGILGFCGESNYEGETVVVGRVGAYCGSTYYENKKIWVSDNALAIKAKNGYNLKYIYYLLKNLNLNQYAQGSSHPLLTHTLLKDLDAVQTLDIEEQKAIAEVLSSLDDKIDLLHRQNQTLEALAETLFRQTFIENPQDNWEDGKLDDILIISSGKALKRAEYDESGTYTVYGANGQIGRTNKFFSEEKVIFTGRVGTLGNIFIIDEKAWLSDNTLIIKPKSDIFFYFIYFFLKLADLAELNVGSTQPLIRQSDVKQIEFYKPPYEFLLKYNEQVEGLFEKLNANIFQIQKLENIRDTLLPKLMSGDVRVKYQER